MSFFLALYSQCNFQFKKVVLRLFSVIENYFQQQLQFPLFNLFYANFYWNLNLIQILLTDITTVSLSCLWVIYELYKLYEVLKLVVIQFHQKYKINRKNISKKSKFSVHKRRSQSRVWFGRPFGLEPLGRHQVMVVVFGSFLCMDSICEPFYPNFFLFTVELVKCCYFCVSWLILNLLVLILLKT